MDEWSGICIFVCCSLSNSYFLPSFPFLIAMYVCMYVCMYTLSQLTKKRQSKCRKPPKRHAMNAMSERSTGSRERHYCSSCLVVP